MYTVSRNPVALLAALLLVSSACTVQQTEVPGLSGPSDFGLNVRLTATPDIINQDGVSQSSVLIVAYGPDGRPLVGVPVRLDLSVGGVYVDYGSLSSKNLMTGPEGRATAVYTAPAAPPPGTGSPYQVVTVSATPAGSNYENGGVATADIRLNTPGVIVPPGGAPTPSFTFSPNSPAIGSPVYFDASASVPGSGASSIVTYEWLFGDGGGDFGRQVDNIYDQPGQYTITLRVTNDRGVTAQTTRTITVIAGTGPTAAFVFSPENPASGQTVIFDASGSVTGPGRVIISYEWVFGDTAASVTTASKTYTKTGGYPVDGVYSVSLTITDSAGMVAVTSKTITVGEVEEEEEEP